MSKPDDNPSPAQLKPVRKRKGGRFVRFLRGVGWTLLGLVALVLILAILGMIISPPRDPKSAALDNEDFGLGFKVGDKWDVSAFEKALASRGITVKRMPQTSGGGPNYTSWHSPDDTFYVSAKYHPDENDSVSNLSFGWLIAQSPISKKIKKEAKKQFPGDTGEWMKGFFYELVRHIEGQYPQVKSQEGIGIGSSKDNVLEAYGKSWLPIPAYEELTLTAYLGYNQEIWFWIRDGRVVEVNIKRGFKHKSPLDRLRCWRDHYNIPYSYFP
jgi:hypothetical protein